jgi:TRAP transporter TAXI family solute receptor
MASGIPARLAGPHGRRIQAILAAGAGGILLAVLLVPRSPPPPPEPQRVAFEIVTGTTSGANLRVAARMAGVLSNPPGISRCGEEEVCGPPGHIVTTRATQVTVGNIQAVEAGDVDSALAEANVIARAVRGEDPFTRAERTEVLRAITNLYGEDIHLVAARSAEILSVADLRNKRVSLMPEGSATIVAARAILRAYRLAEWRIARTYEPVDRAAARLRAGELDAFFILGGTPLAIVSQLLADDVAVLVPIDEAGRRRLLASEPHLLERTIPLGTYPGSPSVETVGVRVVWIARADEPAETVHDMLRAIYHPRNRPLLDLERTGFDFLDAATADDMLPAPLHPGAARYFEEAGLQPAP